MPKPLKSSLHILWMLDHLVKMKMRRLLHAHVCFADFHCFRFIILSCSNKKYILSNFFLPEKTGERGDNVHFLLERALSSGEHDIAFCNAQLVNFMRVKMYVIAHSRRAIGLQIVFSEKKINKNIPERWKSRGWKCPRFC